MATVAENLQTIIDSKAAIKAAIEAKGVAVGDAPLTQYAGKIEEISGGQEEAPENDVNFYDYTGFRVASFSIEEAKALTQEQYDAILPPTHEGLTFQEWNWTLEDIQTYDRQYADIGANYITTDGKTHIFVRVESGEGISVIPTKDTSLNVSFDWGDGSQPVNVVSGTKISHVYETGGNYEIIVTTSGSGKWGFHLNNLFTSNFYKFHMGAKSSIPGGKPTAVVSIPTEAFCDVQYVGGNTIVVPRGEQIMNQVNFMYSGYIEHICFPKSVKKAYTSTRFAYQIMPCLRFVLPHTEDNISISESAACPSIASIISIPNAPLKAYTTGKYFLSNRLEYLDIVQGWTPNNNIDFSASTMWTAYTMTKFFNKLGTTTDAITLTFGSTNLNKLTAEEKAIATNKGYTLA